VLNQFEGMVSNSRYKILFIVCVLCFSVIQGQSYASIFFHSTPPDLGTGVSISTTPVTLGGTNALAGQHLTNWTENPVNSLTAGSGAGGTYFAQFSVSYTSGASVLWTFALYNGGVATDISVSRTTGSDLGNLSANGMLTIAEGDIITLRASNTTGSTVFTPTDIQIVLVQANENSANEWAQMTGAGVIAPAAGAWDSIQTSDEFTMTGSVGTNFTYANNIISNSGSGKYIAIIAGSFHATKTRTFWVGLSIDDAAPDTVLASRYVNSASGAQTGNFVACGILNLTLKNVRVKIYTEAPNNGSLTFSNLTVTLVKIDNAAASAGYAALDLTSSEYINQTTYATLTTTSTMSGITSPNFTLASGVLTPSVGAGIYMVNYSLEVEDTTTTSVINASIFMGSREESHLTSARTISSANQAGVMGGTGFVTIDSDTSVVSIRVNSTTTSSRVNKATFSMFRIQEGSHDGSLPVELTSFTGISLNNEVVLSWETASELNNLGYILERSTGNDEWEEIANYKTDPALQGQGSVTYTTKYTFTDKDVFENITYSYRLSDVDYEGQRTYHDVIHVLVNCPIDQEARSDMLLKGAYPNPFNPHTHIVYEVLEETQIRICIYNMLGEEIATIINEPLSHF